MKMPTTGEEEQTLLYPNTPTPYSHTVPEFCAASRAQSCCLPYSLKEDILGGLALQEGDLNILTRG